jgi:NADH dehydrogenase
MLETARRWYPELARDRIRCTLVASTDRILPALSPSLSEYALNKLRSRGIEVLLGSRVTSVTLRSCFLADGRELPARTCVCTIGDRPHPLLKKLPFELERGKVKVDPCMRVSGQTHVWAIGDCALVINALDGQPSPPTAQFSTRQGAQCADNVVAVLEGREPAPFGHKAQGYLASLGHRSAVAEVFGVRLSGFVAWWVWRTIYLFKLPGLSRKIRVAIDWTLDLIFPRDIVQLQVSRTDRVGRQHHEAGQVILEQGDTADAFFALINGEVEVTRQEAEGPPRLLARLGAGAHFGEEALLSGLPRSATVRALTAVDLLVLGRADFMALSQNLSFMRDTLQKPRVALAPGADQDAVRRQMAAIRVSQRMVAEPMALRVGQPLGEVVQVFRETRFSGFPVLDADGRLYGVLSRTDVYLAMSENVTFDTPIAEFVSTTLVTAFPEDDLCTVLDRMQQHAVRRMPVVDPQDPRRLVGLVSSADLFRARIEVEIALKGLPRVA